MSNVATILARKGNEVIVVNPETSVLQALQMMAEKNIGSVVVMDGKEYKGIFTERDYSRKVILKDKHSYNTLVSDIMSYDFPKVGLLDTVEHCMELMSEKNIRYLPVFDKDELKGIISINDVVKETILQQRETINHLKNYIHS